MAIAHMGDLSVHLTDAHGVLTPAEGRVLRHIARGEAHKEVARRVSRSVNTIDTHVRHIADKLGTHNAVQMVSTAIARGIIRVTVCVLVAVQVGYGLAPRVDMARPVRGGRLTQVSRPVSQLRREVA